MPGRSSAGFVAAIAAIVVAVGVYLGVASSRQRNAVRAAESARAVLALARLDAALWRVDSGRRAWRATHDPAVRASVEHAAGSAEGEIASVVRSDADPHWADLRARLAALVARELAAARAEVAGGSPDTADDLLEIGAVRAELQSAEEAARSQRERAWSGRTAIGDAVFLVANLALAAVLVLAGVSVRRALRAHEDRERERRLALDLQARMMGIVGHDLRNPLSAIQAGATLLSRRPLPPVEARTAARILSSSRRMARMIRDLLDWTRVRAGGGMPVSPRPADLGEICRAVVEETPPRAEVHLARDGDLAGEWDPDRLQQAVGNLVANAVQHAPPGAPVRVRAVGEAGRVRVEVENDGPPIPDDAVAALFEPFRRGGTEPEADGLGLGLYIVRSIAEAHGGMVHVTSGPRRPTTFTLVLPRAAPVPAAR